MELGETLNSFLFLYLKLDIYIDLKSVGCFDIITIYIRVFVIWTWRFIFIIFTLEEYPLVNSGGLINFLQG